MDTSGAKLLPFYIVVDVSGSMSGKKIESAEKILPSIVDALAQNPILSDKVRIGLIDFSDDARVQLPLCDVLEPSLRLPSLSVRGRTSYGAAFELLKTEMEANIKQLKADGYKVHRPAVFFLSDGTPTDRDWQQAFSALVNQSAYPNVIPFGIDEADSKTLQTLIHPPTGEKKMSMYLMDEGQDAAVAITGMAEVMISSVIQSGHSVSQGQSGIMLPPKDDLPDGVSQYDSDDDFV